MSNRDPLARRGNVRWEDVGLFRDEWFGWAILSVLMLHFCNEFATASWAWPVAKIAAKVFNGAIGSVGVDLFLLFSGFGIAHSLAKHPPLLTFFGKRLRRVVLPYAVWGLFFWVLKDFLFDRKSLGSFLLDYSLLSFWYAGVKTFWYVALICVLYALAPWIWRGREKAIAMAMIAGLGVGIGIRFALPGYFNLTEIALLRIPVFFFGMLLAKWAMDGKCIPRIWYALVALSVPAKVVLGLHDTPFARWNNALYALFLVLAYGWVRKRLTLKPVFLSWLTWLGSLSLEFYIVHIGILNVMNTFHWDDANPLVYGLCMALSVPFSMALGRFQRRRTTTRG